MAPRQYHHQLVHFLRKEITFADAGTTVTVGEIPAGSVILKPISGVNVSTAFNGDTTNTVDIGPDDNSDLFGTDLALGAAGFVPLDEAVSQYVAGDTTIVADVVSTDGPTAGTAQIIIAYVPDIDG